MPEAISPPYCINGLRLRPFKDVRNAPYLKQCANLIPTEGGLKQLPAVTYLIGSPALNMLWPHMQLLRADRNLLLFTATAVYNVTESGWTASAITTYDATNNAATKSIAAGTGLWQVAGFQSSWFATKGNSFVYKIPSNTSTRTVVGETALTVSALANHNERLVLGGMAGTHFSTAEWLALFSRWRNSPNAPQDVVVDENTAWDTAWIMYGQRAGGSSDLPFVELLAALGYPTVTVYTNKFVEKVGQLIDSGEMGLHPLRHSGTIYALKPLGDDLVAYAQNNTTLLRVTENGYQGEVILEHGGCGRGCVAGDDMEHVFLTRQGDLYRIQQGKAPEPIQVDEFTGALTLASVVATFDPLERYYFFCDGTNGYCLTRTGLGKCSAIMPSSLLRMSGTDGLIGTHITAADPQAVTVETELLDGARREVWEIARIDIATTDTTAAGWQATAKFRHNKHLGLTSPTATAVLDDGKARVKTSGTEFTILLTNADRTLCDLNRIDIVPGTGKPSLRKLMDA